MSMEAVMQLILILEGIVLLGKTLFSLARRKMTEAFCVPWGIVSVLVILAGILLRQPWLTGAFSTSGWWVVMIIGTGMIWGIFGLTEELAVVIRRNNELVLKVALLDHELEEWKREKGSLCDQHVGESGSGDRSSGNAPETGHRTD